MLFIDYSNVIIDESINQQAKVNSHSLILALSTINGLVIYEFSTIHLNER